jgi:hypothetical protein
VGIVVTVLAYLVTVMSTSDERVAWAMLPLIVPCSISIGVVAGLVVIRVRRRVVFGAGIVGFVLDVACGAAILIGVTFIGAWINGPAEVLRFGVLWVAGLGLVLGTVIGRAVGRDVARWLIRLADQ